MTRVKTAIILAAGMGERLRDVWAEPKALLRFGDESLIERSSRLLRARGVSRIVVVTGYRADAFEPLRGPGVELVANPEFATTGSMASLDRALDVVSDDFLLLEGDIAYEGRALDALIASASADLVLASGPTGATDEVWVGEETGRVTTLSKEAPPERRVAEFTGLTRISAALARRMREAFRRFEVAHGHARMSYDSDALPAAAAEHTIRLIVIPDLLWGEVDYASHHARMRERVWPFLGVD